jgi:hypothetical protein
MGCQEPWIYHEQAEQYKPPCKEGHQQPVGLTAGGLKYHGVYLTWERGATVSIETFTIS